MAEFIERTDTLNEGREKLNTAISDAEQAKDLSSLAEDKATQALGNSESTQTQLDTIVIDGDSSVEAAQARVDEKGEAHETLKIRIDSSVIALSEEVAKKASEDDLQEVIEDLDQLGITSFVRTEGLLSEITSSTKTSTFHRDSEGTVQEVDEIRNSKEIKTTYARDEEGIIQSINREMI